MYPNYGTEMAAMLQFWYAYGDKSWSGEELLTARDLRIETELIGLEESWRGMDWSALD